MVTRVRISNKCRRCRGTKDCTQLEEDHFSCKCGIDLRKRVTKREDIKLFIVKRCCTEGACKALLKKSRVFIVDPELLINHLSASCEGCTFNQIGKEGWKRPKGFCNFMCCPSFSSPCMEAMREILRLNPHRLSIEQAVDFEDVITSENTDDMDFVEPNFTGRVEVYPDMIYNNDPIKLEIPDFPVITVDLSHVSHGDVVATVDVRNPMSYAHAKEASAAEDENKAANDLLDSLLSEGTDNQGWKDATREENKEANDLLKELITALDADEKQCFPSPLQKEGESSKGSQ